MKKILSYTITVTVLYFVLCSGCKKYLDINENPNAAAEPPIQWLTGKYYKLDSHQSFYIASNITSYYAQYLASPSKASSVDIYDDIDASTAWNGLYDIMTDLYDMKNFAAGKGFNAYIGVGDILMAMHLNMASNVGAIFLILKRF